MELTYKRASIRDIDALVDENVAAWKAENKEKYPHDAEREQMVREHAYSYYRRNLTDNEDVVYLAYDGTKLAGIGNVYFVHKRPVLRNQDKERAFISKLYVRPEYHAEGVDFKILDLLVNAALENDAEEVIADDQEPERPALEKYGFQKQDGEWKYAL